MGKKRWESSDGKEAMGKKRWDAHHEDERVPKVGKKFPELAEKLLQLRRDAGSAFLCHIEAQRNLEGGVLGWDGAEREEWSGVVQSCGAVPRGGMLRGEARDEMGDVR